MLDAPLPSLPPLPPLPSTTTAATTRLHASQGAAPHTLVLATEVPVALVINGIAHAVLMATPADLGALALGFLLTEGIIDQVSDCYDLQIEPLSAQCVGLPEGIDAVQVDLQIAARCMARLQGKRRSMSGRTGCGVCGVESFVGLDLDCPRCPPPLGWPRWMRPRCWPPCRPCTTSSPCTTPANPCTLPPGPMPAGRCCT